MNNEISEGSVVIVSSGQAGTVIQASGDFWVLLTNGDIWVGSPSRVYLPQSREELDAAPLNYDRFEARDKAISAAPKKPRQRFED